MTGRQWRKETVAHYRGILVCLLLLATPAAAEQNDIPGSPTGRPPDTPAGAAAEQGSPVAPGAVTSLPAHPFAATGLIGHDVLGADGKKVGKITDLVIDPQSRRISHVVLLSGGLLGFGGKAVLVGVDALRLVPDQPIRSDLSAEMVQGLTEFDPGRIAHLAGGEDPNPPLPTR
jgi:sporulation protein YlmC with PRC-barrel domain